MIAAVTARRQIAPGRPRHAVEALEHRPPRNTRIGATPIRRSRAAAAWPISHSQAQPVTAEGPRRCSGPMGTGVEVSARLWP